MWELWAEPTLYTTVSLTLKRNKLKIGISQQCADLAEVHTNLTLLYPCAFLSFLLAVADTAWIAIFKQDSTSKIKQSPSPSSHQTTPFFCKPDFMTHEGKQSDLINPCYSKPEQRKRYPQLLCVCECVYI